MFIKKNKKKTIGVIHIHNLIKDTNKYLEKKNLFSYFINIFIFIVFILKIFKIYQNR